LALPSFSVLRFLYRRFPLWRRRFQANELAKRIRTVEYLNDNTNALVRYLAADAVEIAFGICWVFLGLGVVFACLLVKVFPMSLGVASFATSISLNVASIVLGPAIRIRGILHDLANYETAIVKLKAKLVELGG